MKGPRRGLCSPPLTDEDFFLLWMEQTDVGLKKNTYAVWPSNRSKTQMWLLSCETVGAFLSDRERGTAGPRGSTSCVNVGLSWPQFMCGKSANERIPVMIQTRAEICSGRLCHFCVGYITRAFVWLVCSMGVNRYVPVQVYVSSICLYYAPVRAIKFNSVWTERTGRLSLVRLHDAVQI